MISSVVTTEWAPNDAPFEPAPTWEDISSKVRTTRLFTGLRSPRDTTGTGSASFEVNNELGFGGWLDRNTWYRWKQIRVTTADFTVWYGWVKSVEHNVGFRDGISQARISAVDVIGMLTEASTDADFATYIAGSPIGMWAARTINNRDGYVGDGGAADIVAWILATVGSDYQGTYGASRMPVFAETKQAGNAIQLLQDFLDAEIGCLGAGGSGQLFFFGRYTDLLIAAVPSEAVFTDDGTGDRYLLGSLVLAAPDETYVDDATFGGPGIDNQRVADVPAGFPPSTFVRTNQSPIADQNWALANAQMTIDVGKQTDTYPRQLTALVCDAHGNGYDPAHPRALTRVSVVGLDVVLKGVTYKVKPISVEDIIDANEGWRSTFGFASLDRVISAYGGSGVFTVGASAWGGPDIFGP